MSDDMTTARPQTSDTKSKIPPTQQSTSKANSSKMAANSNRFCCTDNILLLPVSGSFVGLLGLVLIVLYLVARGLTTSLYLVEGAIPSYAVAAMLMLTGLCVILLVKFRYFALNAFALFLCLGTLTLCLVSVITTALVSIPFLESFSTCIPRKISSECQCYVLADRMNSTNNAIFFPGADDKSYTFFGARTCSSVEDTLKDFLYAMCVVYGFAAVACLFSGLLSLLSLCTHRIYVPKQNDVRVNSSSTTGRRTSETSDTNHLLNNAQTTRGNAERQTSEQRQRTSVSNSRQASRSQTHESSRTRPVQRSASLNQANSNTTPRQVSRHHSVTTADVQQQSGSRSGHRRPPPLIRGGFLQSHVNGPSIPVYTVPGSNEAYIALTDLPSLQMPTMDDIPAYVSNVHGLHDSQFPIDEPPPYTPSADLPPPPMFTPSLEMPDIPERPSPQPDVVDSSITSQPIPQADVTVETVRHVLGNSRRNSPRTPEEENTNTNNLNVGAGSAQSSPQHVVGTVSGNNLSGTTIHESQHLLTYSQAPNQRANDGRTRSQSESEERSRSRSVSRSRENSPTRVASIRQEAVINVGVTQNANLDPLVTGARPKSSNYRNQGSSSYGNRNQSRKSPQHNGDAKKKKRAKSPAKSDKEKSKRKSESAKRLPKVSKDNNLGRLIPETEIRTPKKSPKKKTEHRSRSESRNKDSKQNGEGKKRRKSKSPEKKHRDSRSKSPSKMDQSNKSKKRTSSPVKGTRPLRLNIPTDDSSGTDSMEGMLDLVESVHTGHKTRSRDQKQSVKGKERKKNLGDSHV